MVVKIVKSPTVYITPRKNLSDLLSAPLIKTAMNDGRIGKTHGEKNDTIPPVKAANALILTVNKIYPPFT